MNPVCLFWAVAVATALVGGSGGSMAKARGEAIFSGKEPIKGAVRGHRSGLPPEVVRCRNCHGTEEKKTPPGSPPPIHRSLLLDKLQRRGGPPSSYDPASFCKLLRTGIDPAYVLIARVMPVYEVDDAQCASVWAFLTGETAN